MISVFIDTNCINAKQSIKPLNELERLYADEKILIEKTDTLDTELQEGKGYPRGLKKSLNYIESYGPAVVGHSRLGSCIVEDESDNRRFSKVLSILWGQKARSQYSRQEIKDAMHIATAIRYGGTYFVTLEHNILKKSEEIKKEFVITICTPSNCLKFVKEEIRRLNNCS